MPQNGSVLHLCSRTRLFHWYYWRIMQPKQWSSFLLIGILIFSFLDESFPQSVAQASLPFSESWQSSDLRIIHVNQTSSESFAAGYLRRSNGQLQIRLDRLGFLSSQVFDVFVTLSTHQNGTARSLSQSPDSIYWDKLLVLPSTGNPFCEGVEGRPPSRLCFQSQTDPITGDVVFTIKENNIPGNLRNLQVQAFLVDPQSNDIVDTIGPFRWDAPPPARAPLLLEFWDSLPGVTPAQALRRWDGAHTGPYGSRHGLSHLLSAASQAGIPITLLDLKSPQSLSALDAVGGTSTVQNLVSKGLLLLPDVVYGDPLTATTSLRNSRAAGEAFFFPSNPVIFGNMLLSDQPDNSFVFAELPDSHHIGSTGTRRLLPLLVSTRNQQDSQVNENGLTPESLKALLTIALTPDPSDLIVLGGSLPSSAWGDSRMAAPAMTYIANHPWIWPLTQQDIAAFPNGAGDNQPTCGYTLCSMPPLPAQDAELRTHLREALKAAPANPITSLAWDAYLNLTASTPDATLQTLRSGYLGIVKELLAAAVWADNPTPDNRCLIDFDSDGTTDCILASSQQYLILSPAGARVLLGVSRQGSGFAQWTGSLSQFAVGMGDPSTWQPELGPAGDPSDIPGAFSDVDTIWEKYTTTLKPGIATFTSSDGTRQKRYELLLNGIRVTYSGFPAVETNLPIAFDPEIRFEPGWGRSYAFTSQPGNISWKIPGKGQVQVKTISSMSFSNSLETQRFLNKPENPDQSFSEGHFLPFPTAVIKINSENKNSYHILVTVSAP